MIISAAVHTFIYWLGLRNSMCTWISFYGNDGWMGWCYRNSSAVVYNMQPVCSSLCICIAHIYCIKYYRRVYKTQSVRVFEFECSLALTFFHYFLLNTNVFPFHALNISVGALYVHILSHKCNSSELSCPLVRSSGQSAQVWDARNNVLVFVFFFAMKAPFFVIWMICMIQRVREKNVHNVLYEYTWGMIWLSIVIWQWPSSTWF